MEVDEGSDQNSGIYSHWMAAHARLKHEFTEDEKCNNFIKWLICLLVDCTNGIVGIKLSYRFPSFIYLHRSARITNFTPISP